MLKISYQDNIFLDWLLEILYFPIWWYSVGLAMILAYAGRFLVHREQEVAYFVWLRNIFTPMYGQYDIVGRLVSFVVRLFQVTVRGLLLLVFCFMAAGLVIFWLTLPVITILAISKNIYA